MAASSSGEGAVLLRSCGLVCETSLHSVAVAPLDDRLGGYAVASGQGSATVSCEHRNSARMWAAVVTLPCKSGAIVPPYRTGSKLLHDTLGLHLVGNLTYQAWQPLL